MRLKKIIVTGTIILSFISTANMAFASAPLRVCTTGDYPPLTSYNSDTKTYQGFAIIVANKFAKAIGRKAVFIKTSWANLNEDLKTKCDIAMGGITATPARAKLFNLSNHILLNQKAPIFSNHNNKNFKNFKSIDKKNVTIIENKGGTNEPFAKSKIKRAKIIVLPENLQVYACLNKYPNRKYVMFTDKIEIEYHTGQDKSILSKKGLEFTDIPNNPISYKVYMANKTNNGEKLIDEINNFHRTHLKEFAKWYKSSLHLNYPEIKENCPL